jgi:AcrR family transcriptional regulator
MRAELARTPLRSVGLGEVADAADVARSTIYAIFGSRAGLMVALAEDMLERGGFKDLGRAFRNPDAAQALELSLREAARMYAAEHAPARAILALAAVDPDAAEGAARLERGRRAGVADLAQRLREQGYLRDELSHEAAADILWIVTSFQTFDQLFTGRELAPHVCGERLIAVAKGSLCK